MIDQIKILRKKGGLSQALLAEKVGITQAHLSMIETGKRMPSHGLFIALIESLGAKLIIEKKQ